MHSVLVHIVPGTKTTPSLNMFFLFDRAVDQEELDIAQASLNIQHLIFSKIPLKT
jgi:hypothetical protein